MIHLPSNPLWCLLLVFSVQSALKRMSEAVSLLSPFRRERVLKLALASFAWALLFLPPQASAASPEGGQTAEKHLRQAARSIVAAATESVPHAASDEEAIQRIHLSLEALRLIGQLSEADMEPEVTNLLDSLQKVARPTVAEAIIQMRLARHIRHWKDLSANQRQAALDRFVADVKQNGLTTGHADLLMRVADILENANDQKLAAVTITELLPAFRESPEGSVNRRAPWMEGIARRLELVGRPLEIEGTLLDGSQLDWQSYRGKVVLVDFFANWCEVCRAEVPMILATHRAYRDKGFEVIGISMDDQRSRAEAYRQQTGFRFPTLFSDDPKASGRDHPMGLKYGVTALPRAILVDKDGIVVDTVARGPRLARRLRELLGPPSSPIQDGRLGAVDNADFEESASEPSGVVPARFETEASTAAAPEK